MTTWDILQALKSSLDNAGATERTWELIDELEDNLFPATNEGADISRPIGLEV